MSTFTVQTDPRIQQARRFLDEKLYEEAIELFASIVESYVETHGESSVETAHAYYEYGNALLIKEEDSRNLLSNVEGEGEAGEGDEAEDGDAAEGGDGAADAEGGAEQEEVNDDAQIAWEVLEAARLVLDKLPDADSNATLAEIYLRLGDLKQLNGLFLEAVPEYLAALRIKQKICSPDDRGLSSLYYNLATAHIYNSGEKSCADPAHDKREALGYYTLARQVLQRGDGHDAQGECRELVQELGETIDALRQEIEEASAGASSSSSGSGSGGAGVASSGGPVTTIGFGLGAGSASSGAVPSSVLQVKRRADAPAAPAAGQGDSSAAASSGSATGSTLQVKKKAKLEPQTAQNP